MATAKENKSIADDWLEPDRLGLIEGWARDGYTFQDIANRIGISTMALRKWRDSYEEFNEALRKGREIVDYKVENALLKSALGYRTKEVKVTTLMQKGKVVQMMKEVTSKDQAPNVSACQVWLYNRLPQKWKKNRDSLIELDEEDSTIQVTVTRADKNESEVNKKYEEQQDLSAVSEVRDITNNQSEAEVDEEWQDEINKSITVSKNENQKSKNKNIKTKSKDKLSRTSQKSKNVKSKTDSKGAGADLDYWPDDWEEN
jgi:hypothetical protein